MAGEDNVRGGRERGSSIIGGAFSGMMRRPSPEQPSRATSATSVKSNYNSLGNADEMFLASGNGVSLSITLAEPALYLQGFDQADSVSRATTMLRGTFHLKVTKSAKIKSISLNFRGRAETEWPEGELVNRSILNHVSSNLT